MDGKEKMGYMQWDSQSVDYSAHQWTPKESPRTSNGVGKPTPSFVLPSRNLYPPRRRL